MITNIERKRYIWHKILMPNIISKTSSIMNKFLYATWAEKITLAYYKNSNITHNKIKQHWALIYKCLLNTHYHQNVVQSICFLSKVTILINNNTKLSNTYCHQKVVWSICLSQYWSKTIQNCQKLTWCQTKLKNIVWNWRIVEHNLSWKNTLAFWTWGMKILTNIEL